MTSAPMCGETVWMTRLMDVSYSSLDADGADQLAPALILGGDEDLERRRVAADRLGALVVDALAEILVGKGLLQDLARGG